MSKKYRKVDPRFWTDEKVQDLETAEELALAMHMFTGPATNRIGLYHFMPGGAAEMCKIPLDRFHSVMANVLSTLGWHFYERRKVLWLPRWWKYNEPENPKVLIGNLDDLHDVPISPLDVRFFCSQADLMKRVWRDGSTASDTFVRSYRRKYPDRIRIAQQTYLECRDAQLPDFNGGKRRRTTPEDDEHESGAPRTEAMASAYDERIRSLKKLKRLKGRDLKQAESLLLAQDWNTLDQLLTSVEDPNEEEA